MSSSSALAVTEPLGGFSAVMHTRNKNSDTHFSFYSLLLRVKTVHLISIVKTFFKNRLQFMSNSKRIDMLMITKRINKHKQ